MSGVRVVGLGGAGNDGGPVFVAEEGHEQRPGRVKTRAFLGSLADPMCLQWRLYRGAEGQRAGGMQGV